MFNNTCQTPPNFMLSYEGDMTENLPPGVAASNLQNSLNNLPSINSAGSVSVTLEVANSTMRGYRVKFAFDQPESTVMLRDASQPSGQFVTVVVDKAGISSSKGFSLRFGGVKSRPIHPNDTQEEITKVLEELFTTQCTFDVNTGE